MLLAEPEKYKVALDAIKKMMLIYMVLEIKKQLEKENIIF
tara:strand:- start:221 stop:340 length:120 start_codon:yes stop_codon:yes gene_type:complete